MRLQRTQRRGVGDLGAGVAVAAAGSARHRIIQHVPARLCCVQGFEHALLGEVVQRQQVAVDAAFGGTIRRCRDLIVVHPGQGFGFAEVDGQFARIELQRAGE